MHPLIRPVLWLCVTLVAAGCNPKQPPAAPSPSATDTTTPPVPAGFAPPRDSTRTVPVPGDPMVRYHRHLVGMVFDDSTSGATVNALLRKYRATIAGGYPGRGTRGAYVLQVPDTVTTYDGLLGLLNVLDSEPGVDFAFGLTWRGKIVPRTAPEEEAGGHQVVTVRGRIVDHDSGAPVTYAEVDVSGLTDRVRVDSSTGRFEVALPGTKGCIRLGVRAIGYYRTERTVELGSDQSIELRDIPLRTGGIPEGATLLLMSCRPAPGPSNAPWGVDTVPVR